LTGSSALDDGGDSDKDVAEVVEDGVGESLPHEVGGGEWVHSP